MDELFETITLIQTKKIQDFPVILMGTEYWKDLTELMAGMIRRTSIDEHDLKLILATDDVNEAMMHIRKYAIETYQLKQRVSVKPVKILGEQTS